MPTPVTIRSGDVAADAELNDTPTAEAIRDALPVESTVATWGEEIYFELPVDVPLADDARQDVNVGELAYWPTGRAMCVFFGATPASGPDGKPRAAGPVNPIGRVLGDPSVFADARDGETIVVEEASV